MYEAVRRIEGSVQWWLGDHLRLGQITYEQAVSVKLSKPDGADGLKYQTLANYKTVAKAFPLSGRPEELSWSCYTRTPCR